MDPDVARRLKDLRRVRRAGAAAVTRLQRARLAEMVDHARQASVYYQEFYRDLPARVDDPSLLPVTDKARLMSRFDDWVTDPRVTLATARGFLADPERIGTPFLGDYLLITSSGTSGQPGVFVQDRRYDAVSEALQTHFLQEMLGLRGIVRVLLGGQRVAALFAVDGHYAGFANAQRVRRRAPSAARKLRVFSVHQPLAELVAQLNEFRPALLMGYAGTIALLGAEQIAGRLRLRPTAVIATAEGFEPGEYRRLERVFGATVRNGYGCSEFAYTASGCSEEWLHVNSDWVVLEPVDADLRPTPPGELSHTVLLSNLANWVQPILRYDLGDRVLSRPDPCPCGSPLPAIRVVGRVREVLGLPGSDGDTVEVDALLLTSVADRVAGLDRFQLQHAHPEVLRVRLRATPGSDPDQVWSSLEHELRGLLSSRGLPNIRLERAPEPPQPSPGGKYQRLIPLS